MKPLKVFALPLVVFITGACVLIIEIVATRVLSPFYGSTIFTVSSVITVILAALSFGYYVGGGLADARPTLNRFFWIILLSGLCVLLFHAIGKFTLPLFGEKLSLSTGPLLFSFLLFFCPAFLLGTLSPFAIKLQSLYFPEQGIGRISGGMFFWSTLGSITGSLSAGFVLIPLFGVSQIIAAVGAVLFALGLIPLLWLGVKKSQAVLCLILFATLLGSVSYATSFRSEEAVYLKDGVYQQIHVYDVNKGRHPIRICRLDEGEHSSMYLDLYDPRKLVLPYSRHYTLYKFFTPEMAHALIIGGGAYSLPKAFLRELPEVKVDVVEIEPVLYELAKKYFRLEENPRLRNYAEDGRRFLLKSQKKYDMIFSDVYFYSVPAHLATQEFFSLARRKLNENGILILNIVGNLMPSKSAFAMSEMKTFRTVFPNSYYIAVDAVDYPGPQNILFIGYNSDRKVDLKDSALTKKLIDIESYDLSRFPILTDNYAPVEYLAVQAL